MIQNSFTVTHAGRTVTRHNSLRNVFNFYMTSRKLCAYMYVMYSGTSYYFDVPTLVCSNFDPSKGRLFATYRMEVPAHDLEGKFIEKIGFSSSKAPDVVVSECAVVFEKLAEPLVVTGTMYLSLNSEIEPAFNLLNSAGESVDGEMVDGVFEERTGDSCVALLGGDNKLVRMLLGVDAFELSQFRMTYGKENMPMCAYVYEEQYPSVSSAPVLSSQSVKFSGSFSASATDAVLLCGGSAVLRALPTLETIEEYSAYTATENDSITVPADGLVTGIVDVKINYAPCEFGVQRVPSALSYVRQDKVSFPEGVSFKSDTKASRFAFVKEGRGAFFVLDENGVHITDWFEGQDVLMCENGAAFILKPKDYIPLDESGASTESGGAETDEDGSDGYPLVFFARGREKPLGIKLGKKCAAASAKSADGRECYVIATWLDGFVKIYTLDADFNVGILKIESDNEENVRVFALPEAVAAVSLTKPPVCFSPSGENLIRKNWLAGIVNSAWFSTYTQPVYDSGRLLLYDSYFDRTNYYADMSGSHVIATAYGRHYGELNVRNKGITTDISTVGSTNNLVTLVGGAMFAAVAGRILYFFLADGSIKAYYIKSSSIRLRSGRITAGFPVSFRLLRKVAKAGRFEIRILPN